MTTTPRAVQQVRQHREALAWWVRAFHAFPLGLVPLPTAARILGVSPRRVRTLIDEGRVRLIDGMPGGTERDRFVPLVDLIDGPFVLNRGQPGVWGPENRFTQNFLDRDTYRYKRKARKHLRPESFPAPMKGEIPPKKRRRKPQPPPRQ